MCDLYSFGLAIQELKPSLRLPWTVRTRWWKRSDHWLVPRHQRDLTGRPIGTTQKDLMTDYGSVPKEIELGNGESVIVTFDPRANSDMKDAIGQMGGTVYTFNLTSGGRPATMKGGKRLLRAIQGVVGPVDPPTKIEIKASGEPRSLERTYAVKKVKA